MKRFDVVLIGSGISSLVAAALISKTGKSVCILEQHHKVGGYMHNFRRFGHGFDTGSHYIGALGPDQPFRILLQYCGVFKEELFVPLQPEAYDVFRFPSFEVKFPVGYAETLATLTKEFPSEEFALHSFFKEIKKATEAFPTYTFEPDIDEAALLPLFSRSLYSVVDKLTTNPKLRAVLLGHCTLHGVAPQDVSFGLHSLMLDSMINGPYGFSRGGDGLADSFTQVIKSQGGEILTKCRVTGFEIKDHNITQVKTESGESVSGDWVIAGIHPLQVFDWVGWENFKPAFRDRMSRMKESCGFFGVSTEAQVSKKFSARQNYYFFDDENPDTFLSDRELSNRIGPVFISSADRNFLSGDEMAPVNILSRGPIEWFKSWQTNKYGKRDVAYTEFKKQRATQVMESVLKQGSDLFTGWGKSATSTPLTNLHFNGTKDGAPYGIYHSMDWTGMKALGPRTAIRNLLLTGQNTLFPGLLGASVSGLRTAGHLLGIKPLIRELRSMRKVV